MVSVFCSVEAKPMGKEACPHTKGVYSPAYLTSHVGTAYTNSVL